MAITEANREVFALPKERMSLEEFLAWRDEDVGAEWEEGAVGGRAHARCARQRISRFLLMLLAHWLEANEAGEVLAAPFAMHLPKVQRVREPDLLVVLKENLSRLHETHSATKGGPTRFFSGQSISGFFG